MKFSVPQFALLLLTAVSVSAAQSAVYAAETGAVRVLQFPDKQSFGTIRFHKSKRTPIAARGRVEIPADSPIELLVSYDGGHDLSPLRNLAPDAIHKLTLARLEINDNQLKDLENLTGLNELDLEETDIGNDGLRWLHKLTKLKHLRLKSTLVTGKGLVFLKPLTSLTDLSLSSNSIGDEGLENLVVLKNLKSLVLTRSQITDQGLKRLGTLEQVKRLEIEFNKLTDAGLASLVGWKNLRQLLLTDNRITVNCLKYLKQLPALDYVVYSPRNFSPKDLATLKTALPHCRFEDYVKDRDVQYDLFRPLR